MAIYERTRRFESRETHNYDLNGHVIEYNSEMLRYWTALYLCPFFVFILTESVEKDDRVDLSRTFVNKKPFN